VTISFISAAAAASDSVAIGTHAAGDTIITWTFNDGVATAPSLPSGWINVFPLTGSLTGVRLAYKVAQSSSETSGTWTNADGIIAVVYRPAASNVLVPGLGAGNLATSTTVNYAAIAVANDRTNTDQWILGFAAMRSDANALETAPSGMTNRSNLVGTGWEMASHDTNANASSWASTNVSVTNSATWRTATCQLFEQPFYSAGGGGGARMVNVRGGADQ
jgi:hypothetical protein